MTLVRLKSTSAALSIGLMVLTLSGCARLGVQSRVDPITIAVYPGGESRRDAQDIATTKCPFVRGVGSFSRGAINLDCFEFPEDIARDGRQLAYARAVISRRDRNRLASLLLKQSDDLCVEEMGRLTANEATVNASLNIVSTAATTAANIVTGEQAAEILTGIGTFSTASRSHLNSNVYRNTVAYAISRAISIERKRLRDLLEARYGHNETVFTVDEAIRAANEYHGICSFYKGLELVLASVEGDQRSRDTQGRRATIEGLEEQIRRYREQMTPLTGDQRAPYEEKIRELLDRIQVLTLASVPATETGATGSKKPDEKAPAAGEDTSGVNGAVSESEQERDGE